MSKEEKTTKETVHAKINEYEIEANIFIQFLEDVEGSDRMDHIEWKLEYEDAADALMEEELIESADGEKNGWYSIDDSGVRGLKNKVESKLEDDPSSTITIDFEDSTN